MKQVVATAMGLLLILFLLPLLLISDAPLALREAQGEDKPDLLPAYPKPAVNSNEPAGGADATTRVKVAMADGQTVEMSFADYLWSVVAAEMPASFEPEALKAQAVTARTYASWKMAAGENNHPQANVCADINCCQAFITPEQAAANWGNSAAAYTQKIKSAVADTDGKLITYGGAPIQAVFFSSASGQTRDAVEVWGNAVPYLVGVDSPEGEGVPNYHSTVVVPVEEFRAKLLAQYPGAVLSGDTAQWFANKTATPSGGVASMDVGGVTIQGTALRILFGLRSTNFTVEAGQDAITFQVTGYGHGVGMSQYGANELAKQGKTWQEILTWYYTGVEIL